MNSEATLLSGEIKTIKARIEKADRRIAAGKAPLNGESEQDRKDRLTHILGKKEERLQLLLSGKEC